MEAVMNKSFPLLTLGIFLATAPLRAAEAGSALLQERFKTALNDLALKVRAAGKPEQKREIMLRFADGMQQGLRNAEEYAAVTAEDKASLEAVQAKFHAYSLELNGREGFDRVADSDLDEYAGYMRQQMEQAPIGGGIYISAGALIIILLLLVLIL
jgi:hypothetical protein